MKVSELIAFLQKQDQDLQVLYKCCSEFSELDERYIEILELCDPRGDGWVADKRPDQAYRKYLVLPGN